jgi:hypothetical protein
VQIKWKMCNGFNEDNFKHKLHMAHNLWEEAPFPSLYYTLCLPWGLHPNVIFPQYSQVEVPKLGLLLSQNFECSYLFQIKFSLKIQGEYLTALENIFPKVYSMFQSDLIWPLLLRDLWSRIKFPIWLPPLLLIITHPNQVQMNNKRAF